MCNSDSGHKVISLSRAYPSIYNVPVLNRFEDSIFRYKYFTNCLSCGFCGDICCSFGVDIDVENIGRIMETADALEAYTRTSRHDWFHGEYITDAEFPGGRYTRVKTRNGICVFKDPEGRGCMIHSFCLKNGLDFHRLKPMVSSLFPITFDEGLLHPMDEVMENSLVCLNEGESIYRGVRSELLFCFGEELVKELDTYERELAG